MKRRAMAIILGACSIVAHAEKPKEAVYIEASSYDEALELAAAEDRRLYLLFKGNPCSWCDKQMEEFKDRKVIEAMDGMVFHLVDAFSRRDLAKKYGVSSVPSHRIVNPKGEIVRSHMGYMDADMLSKFLKN